MISQNYYDSVVLETLKLMGIDSKMNREMAAATFQKVRYNYDDNDLKIALDSALNTEIRLNYPIIIKHLRSTKSSTLENSWNETKDREEREVKEVWKSDNKERDKIARYWIDVMKTILRYEPDFNSSGMSGIERSRKRQSLIREHNNIILGSIPEHHRDIDDFIPEIEA